MRLNFPYNDLESFYILCSSPSSAPVTVKLYALPPSLLFLYRGSLLSMYHAEATHEPEQVSAVPVRTTPYPS